MQRWHTRVYLGFGVGLLVCLQGYGTGAAPNGTRAASQPAGKRPQSKTQRGPHTHKQARKPRAASGRSSQAKPPMRGRRVHYPSSPYQSGIRVENRDVQPYRWVLDCQGVQMQGRIGGDETITFQGRSANQQACSLKVNGHKQFLVLGTPLLIRNGRLRPLRARVVVYPPIRVYGDASLAKDTASQTHLRQWASAAKASSEYSPTSYGAIQLIGPPNVLMCTDSGNAWCPAKLDNGREWLILSYPKRSNAVGVIVYASYYPGTVRKVQARTGAGWVTVWQGNDPTKGHCPGIFGIRFQEVVTTRTIRIILDTKYAPGWNEIDAVQLVSQP